MSDERHERIAKAERLRRAGHEPYPHRFERSHLAAAVVAGFEELERSAASVSVAGRVMARRDHGKTAFLTLVDGSGRLQVYLRRDELGDELFALYEDLDLADFVGVSGRVIKTRTGEVSVQAKILTILSKALRPLPSQWHGLKDVETRYRQRYLDLVMNPDVREVFLRRTRIVDIIRRVFNSKGGIEVETPVLQALYGGASARPFVTHHNALNMPAYLRIADELYLKRLIVAGLECVYEIGKDFRNEGMDRSHNPEFTMVEIYWAYHDYSDMMDLTEELIVTIARELTGGTVIEYQGDRIDLTPPWPRRPMLELIEEATGVDCGTASEEQMRQAVTALIARDHLPTEAELAELAGKTSARLIDELFTWGVQPQLLQPTFVTDYPKETSPLAKVHRRDPRLTERFELFIWRREMANAFSELNDPLDQRARFEAQQVERLAGDEEAQPLDEDYLRALEVGMPPAGGLGIGVDRLVMLFTNQASIFDVILFPLLRPEEGGGTRKES